LQGLLLRVDVAEIAVHEADDPDAVVDLLDPDAFAGRYGRWVGASEVDADAPAGGRA
jgi:hypothetical protein